MNGPSDDPRWINTPHRLGVENWKFIARASTVEAARDELAAWRKADGMIELPAQDRLRWHHGLSGDGEYWDVWLLDSRNTDHKSER